MPRKKKIKKESYEDHPEMFYKLGKGLIFCQLCINDTPMLLSSFGTYGDNDNIHKWSEEKLRKEAVDSLLWRVRESPYEDHKNMTEDHLLGFTDEELYNWRRIKFYGIDLRFRDEPLRTIG